MERFHKKLHEVKENAHTFKEQKEYEILQQVVLKHHNKQKLLKKKEKEIMELRLYNVEKK